MTPTEELVEDLQRLPMKAKSYILRNIDDLKFLDIADMWTTLQCCESPIEQILCVALYIKTKGTLYFEPQMEINCGKKTYYADIGIYGDEIVNSYLNDNFVLIIECDGYEFHQKTKKQVEYDNKREYDIKLLGYDILRFSGSEIYNDVDECVIKILNYISSKGKKNEWY